MAALVDASSPAVVSLVGATGVAAAGTTASFDPPASLLVYCGHVDTNVGATPTLTMSNNGTALTWTTRVARGASEGTSGYVFIASAELTAGRTGMTVTASLAGHNIASASAQLGAGKLRVITGYDTSTPFDSIGANNEGSSTTDPTNTTNLTPGADGLLIAAATDWNAVASIASSNLTNLATALISGHITYINGYRTCSSGVAVNANLNPSAAPDFNWVQLIVRAAAGGSGAIAGSIALTLTPTGTMSGSGALAGSVALTLTPTGALTGAGSLAGVIGLSLAPAGALTGAGALAGDIAMAIAPTGTLIGAGALAGSVSLAFDVAGAFEAGGMLGDVPLALTVSGALTGSGALAGSIPVALTPTGTLTGAGALTGTVPLAFDLTGELTGTAAGDIAGSITLSVNVTGALTGAGALTGDVVLTLGMSGALTNFGADEDDGFADAWVRARERRRARKELEQERKLQQQRDEETVLILMMLA